MHGFVRVQVMRCMGLTHTSRLPGGGYALHGTHSHINCREKSVGGGGCLPLCEPQGTHPLPGSLAASPPICATACELEQPMRHFTAAKNRQTPAVVSPRNKLVPQICCESTR